MIWIDGRGRRMGGRRMAERRKRQIPNWERGSRFPKTLEEGVQVTPSPRGFLAKQAISCFFSERKRETGSEKTTKFLSGILHRTSIPTDPWFLPGVPGEFPFGGDPAPPLEGVVLR